MSQEFHAIYENGVLRPLVPLSLPESTEVKGILEEANPISVVNVGDPILGLLSEQSELLDQIVEEAFLARESQPFRTDG